MKAKHYEVSGFDLVTQARRAKLRESQGHTTQLAEWALAAAVIAGTAFVMWIASQTVVAMVTAYFARVLP